MIFATKATLIATEPATYVICTQPKNIEHLIMQCPVYESMRDRMFKDNRKSSQVYSDALDANPEKTFLWIMGGQIEGLEFEQMLDLWLIAGCVINQIYKETIKSHPCVK